MVPDARIVAKRDACIRCPLLSSCLDRQLDCTAGSMPIAAGSTKSDYVNTELEPSLAPGLVALCRAKPKDPVRWLAAWLLEHKPPPVAAVARHYYVVDCGSRHTQLHHVVAALDGGLAETGSCRLRPGEYGNLPLGEALKTKRFAEEWLPLLKRELLALGWGAGRADMAVFVGATGGVRSLLQSGAVTAALLAEFEAALAGALGLASGASGRVTFEVLSGDDEARYEFAATRTIFAPLFAQHDKPFPGFLSGGGATCQFAYGSPPMLCSLDCATKDTEKAIRAEGRTALAPATAALETTVDAWWPTSGLPARLGGSFVGIELHQDAARLGFHSEFLSPPEVVRRIDRIVDDLLNQSGEGWAKAETKCEASAARTDTDLSVPCRPSGSLRHTRGAPLT